MSCGFDDTSVTVAGFAARSQWFSLAEPVQAVGKPLSAAELLTAVSLQLR
jgi:hypothetical protein